MMVDKSEELDVHGLSKIFTNDTLKTCNKCVWLLWLMLLNAVWTVKYVTECIKTRYFEWKM